MAKIGLIKPDKVESAGLVGDGGFLEIFVGTGVDVLEVSNNAGDGKILAGDEVADGRNMRKIKIPAGEVIEQIFKIKNSQTVELKKSFGPDTGKGDGGGHAQLCYHYPMRVKRKTIKKAILIVTMLVLLISGLVPTLGMLIK